MKKIQTFINCAAVTSEISHVFCCALPTLFSVLALLSGLGVIGVMPSGVTFLHDIMHDYELPIIVASGAVLLIGWVLYYVSYRIDCRSSGCEHEPCGPKKKRSSKLLLVATILFVVNVSVYSFVHVPSETHTNAEASHAHEDHEGHDH